MLAGAESKKKAFGYGDIAIIEWIFSVTLRFSVSFQYKMPIYSRSPLSAFIKYLEGQAMFFGYRHCATIWSCSVTDLYQSAHRLEE